MTADAQGPKQPLSWDTAKKDAPERPTFASSLPEEQLIDRPKRALVALILVLVALLCLIAATALSALRLDEVREALTAALPYSATEGYSDSDIERAVNVLLGAVAGIGLVLALVQALSARTLVRKRSTSARIVLIVTAVVSAPVAVVALAVRGGGTLDLVLSGAGAASLLVAVVLVCTPTATTWLQQSEPRRVIPVLPPKRSTDEPST